MHSIFEIKDILRRSQKLEKKIPIFFSNFVSFIDQKYLNFNQIFSLVSSNNIQMKLSILVHCGTGNLWTCLALSKAKPFVIFHSEEWRAGPMSAFVRVNAFICTLALNLATSMAFLEAFFLLSWRRLHFLIDMGFRWLNCAPNLTVNNIFLKDLKSVHN